MYKYKVSIIMAVYNVEPFLREAIDSVVEQDIGFENIQLILVDDGSPDGSPAICDEYAAKYPDNILVVHKENGGVSSARNEGIKYIDGQFVNFMDSDDKLSPDVVRIICEFFTMHLDETDVVSFPMIFFDEDTGEHILNYKYKKGSRIIDLDRDWQNPQLSMSSAFVKAECLKDFRFDERLTNMEDAQVLQKILSGKCTLGVVDKVTYWYRRRNSVVQSASTSATNRPQWYVPCMRYFHKEIIEFYLNRYHYLPRFIQNTLMYDLQWRITQEEIPENVLTAKERSEYLELLQWVLSQINDDIIDAQRNIWVEHKTYAYMLKYGGKPVPVIRDNNISFLFDNCVRFKLSECSVRLQFINFEGSNCILEGIFYSLPTISEDIIVIASKNNTLYECELCGTQKPVRALGQLVQTGHIFKCSIPLTAGDTSRIEFYCKVKDILIPLKEVRFGRFFPVSAKYSNAYYVKNNWILKAWNRGLVLEPWQRDVQKEYEKNFRKELWKSNKLGERNAALARFVCEKLLAIKRKPIWLINDRAGQANDNGEAFFCYMRKYHPDIDAYFVISKDCADYKRLSKVGPVLVKDSFKHKLFVLMSDYILSSHGEDDIFNPFMGYSEPYRSYLADNRFIFLQHGITQNDISSWLNKYNKNIYGFVTAAKPEYQSIMEGQYYYNENQVWLTGFPRFDRLYSAEEKQITIMPTWRRYLCGKPSRETGIFPLISSFKESTFLTFYNGLLNHPRLLKEAKTRGYKIAFFPHPNLQDHLDVFQKNDQVEFLGKETAYREIFANSSIIISDYSSTLFDFAYCRKPIIYTQFDKEEFYAGSILLDKGYFDYERDGFGEVEYTLEDTVDRIIEYMENGCQLKDKYRERIDSFFAFNDKNNCQRVYERIIELDKKSKV